jgi:hypothetical protein
MMWISSFRLPALLRRSCLLAAVVGCTAAAGPLDELPFPEPTPDPQSLLEALLPRLPPNWRLGQPSTYLGVAEVRVNIVGDWRGNPVAAAVSLCPGTEDTIWQQTRLIRLTMRWHQRNWPPYDCRP